MAESTRSSVATAMVMASTATSRLLGFVRIAVVGAVFGASGNADVLNLVFNIPNNLRKLLAEGALSSAFIPVLSREIVADSSARGARELVRRLIGFQLVVLLPLLILSTIFSQPIVNTILDFPEIERQLLAADLFRYLIHYLLLISVAAVLMGALNAHGRFGVSAIAPLWFSVAVIVSILALHSRIGVYSMVIGVLVGGLGQIAIQLPSARRLSYTIMPRFDFRDEKFRVIMRQWLPVVTTSSIFTLNQQIALFFASALTDGSGSAMTNALVFWQLPFGVFSASITTVLFPKMSREWAAHEYRSLRRTLHGGLGALALLLIPSAMGLFVLRHEMIAVALQRGAFVGANTALAARVLAGYCLGLFSVGAFTFLQRFYYACGNYRIPLAAAIVALVLDVGLSLWLKETRLGVAGLAVANSVAFTVGFALMLIKTRSIIGPERGTVLEGDHSTAFEMRNASRRDLTRALLLAIGAAVAAGFMTAGLRTALGWHGGWAAGSTMRNAGRFGILASVGVITILVLYRMGGVRVATLMRRKKPS